MKEARKFTAFISYRHCPLDIRVAEELHKKIERYRLPKDLRADGRKNLGLVFRDRDELPLSSNLTQDIYEALDHAQFLIVVCTPETPKSQWVEREIQYFIEKHGRDRILTVLAAGTSEESIPKIITHVYDDDGQTLLQQIEPLCAYLVDTDEKKILKNLKKEFLRLVAAILNCHYDALVQRQKRYRAQQITCAAAIVAVVALLFAGMLINRNQQITQKNQEILQKNEEIQQKNDEIAQQLLQTQINESKALTLLSAQQLSGGDRISAIESALTALPHDGDNRPYYAPAEDALASAMNIYNPMKLDYYLTIPQNGEICSLTLSEDGRYLITLDTKGTIRCFDPLLAAALWETAVPASSWTYEPVYNDLSDAYTDAQFIERFEVIDTLGLVMFSDWTCTYAFSLETGELIHTAPFCTERLSTGSYFDNQVALSADERYFVQCSRPYAQDVGLGAEPEGETSGVLSFNKKKTHYVEVYDTKTFRMLHDFPCNWPESWDAAPPAFSPDGSKLALAFVNASTELVILDTQSWNVVHQSVIESAEGEFMFGVHLVWLSDDELVLSYEQRKSSEIFNTYFVKYCEDGSTVSSGPIYFNISSPYSLEPSHYITDSHIFYTLGSSYVYAIDRETLQRTMGRETPLAGVYLREDNTLMVMEQTGKISYRTAANKTTASYIHQPDTAIRIAAGTAGGTEILCLVPDSDPYKVMIIAEPQLQKSVAMESPPIEKYDSPDASLWDINLVVSPSGKELFAMDPVGSAWDGVAITVYDACTLEITGWNRINVPDYYGFHTYSFCGFSADETKLFFKGYVYDRLTDTLTKQEKGEITYGDSCMLVDYPPFYNQRRGTPVLSAYMKGTELFWWTDGTDRKSASLPYEMATYNIKANYHTITSIGYNGLYVLPLYKDYDDNRTEAFGIFSTTDGQWHLMENPVNSNGFPVFAIASGGKQVAFADMDHMLRIYDYDRNAVIRHWPISVNANSILDMQFVAQDQYLMIVMDDYLVHLISMEDGSEVGRYQCGVGMVPYVCNGFLYLLTNTRESLRINLQSSDVVGRFRNLYCPLTVNGRETAIYTSPDSKLQAMPVYNWEELSEIGRALVNRARSLEK